MKVDSIQSVLVFNYYESRAVYIFYTALDKRMFTFQIGQRTKLLVQNQFYLLHHLYYKQDHDLSLKLYYLRIDTIVHLQYQLNSQADRFPIQ